MEDLARLNKTEELYTNKDWYKVLKSRWSNYYDSLEKFWLKMFFRSKSGGSVSNTSPYGSITFSSRNLYFAESNTRVETFT